MSERRQAALNPFVVLLIALIVPGLGHLVLGRRGKALACFVLIMGILLTGCILSYPGFVPSLVLAQILNVLIIMDAVATSYRIRTPKWMMGPGTAAVAAWWVPGGAHWLLGRRAKALLYFVLIVGTFVAGWLISNRENVFFEQGRWHTLVQLGMGPLTLLFALVGTAGEPKATVMSTFEIGTLYTMVAGLLSVLVVMDAVLASLRIRKL